MPAFDSEELLAIAGDLLPDVVALRRAVHRHPELGLETPLTQAAVLDALDGLGLEIRRGRGLGSVVADLRGGAGDGPTVLLRADSDALPMPEDTGLDYASEIDGAMHACGHDAHVAMLVGAARLLAGRRELFGGTVRFMFQPGEEGFAGARLMIEEGVLDDPQVDVVFGLHVTPNIPAGCIATKGGPLLASADVFDVAVIGKGGHASTPHLANDPMPVAAEMVQALQTYTTRRVDVFNPAVITVARMQAGTTSNVIPERVEMQGTLRCLDERVRNTAIEAIERIVTNIAAAHEMTATVEVERGYPPTVNDGAFAGFALRVARDLLGLSGPIEMPSPIMGAEDFSYVLEKRTGAFAFLGACPPDLEFHLAPPCHSNRMRIDEDAMTVGVAYHAAVALAFLAGGFDPAAGLAGGR